MEKEQEKSQTVELEKLIASFDAMSKFAFWTGTQRGVMSSMNTIMLKYVGMSMEEYQKRMVKPQIHAMIPISQVINLLAGLLKEIGIAIEAAEMLAKQQAEKEAKNEQ